MSLPKADLLLRALAALVDGAVAAVLATIPFVGRPPVAKPRTRHSTATTTLRLSAISRDPLSLDGIDYHKDAAASATASP
jgi:hypothetical protein